MQTYTQQLHKLIHSLIQLAELSSRPQEETLAPFTDKNTSLLKMTIKYFARSRAQGLVGVTRQPGRVAASRHPRLCMQAGRITFSWEACKVWSSKNLLRNKITDQFNFKLLLIFKALLLYESR